MRRGISFFRSPQTRIKKKFDLIASRFFQSETVLIRPNQNYLHQWTAHNKILLPDWRLSSTSFSTAFRRGGAREAGRRSCAPSNWWVESAVVGVVGGGDVMATGLSGRKGMRLVMLVVGTQVLIQNCSWWRRQSINHCYWPPSLSLFLLLLSIFLMSRSLILSMFLYVFHSLSLFITLFSLILSVSMSPSSLYIIVSVTLSFPSVSLSLFHCPLSHSLSFLSCILTI